MSEHPLKDIDLAYAGEFHKQFAKAMYDIMGDNPPYEYNAVIRIAYLVQRYGWEKIDGYIKIYGEFIKSKRDNGDLSYQASWGDYRNGFIIMVERWEREKLMAERKAKYNPKPTVKPAPEIDPLAEVYALMENHTELGEWTPLQHLISNDLLDSFETTKGLSFLPFRVKERQLKIQSGVLTDAPPESKVEWRNRMLKENKFEPFKLESK